MSPLGLILLLLLLPSPIWADIYYYIDPQGVTHFSNAPTEGPYRFYLREGPWRPEDYDPIIERVCERYGVDPALVKAMIKVESEFNPKAVSTKGAQGLMQLMPETASLLRVADPFDPSQNIEAGVKYLKHLLVKFRDLTLALAAYNAGEGIVEELGAVPDYPETRAYVEKVLRYYSRFRRSYAR